MPKQNRLILILFVLVVLMGAEIIYLIIQNRNLKAIINDPRQYFKTLAEEDVVPSFSAQDINGNDVNLRYHEKAPITLLFWFAPGCSSCTDNLEFWNYLYEKYSGGNYRFLGLWAGLPEEAGPVIELYDILYPVMCADDPYIVEVYKGNVLPQTVIISPTGVILGAWAGALEAEQEEEIIDVLE